MPLIRTHDAIELPAAGRWPLGAAPAVTIAGTRSGRGDRASEVSGSLVVGDDLLDVSVELSMLTPDGTPIEVEAALVETDPDGRWTLSGDLTVAGRTDHVIVDARYHGVFRHGSHAWTELSLGTSVARSTFRRRRMTIDANVIFDAPADVTRNAA